MINIDVVMVVLFNNTFDIVFTYQREDRGWYLPHFKVDYSPVSRDDVVNFIRHHLSMDFDEEDIFFAGTYKRYLKKDINSVLIYYAFAEDAKDTNRNKETYQTRWISLSENFPSEIREFIASAFAALESCSEYEEEDYDEL